MTPWPLSWGQAISIAWENFTGVRGGRAGLRWRIALCVLLALGVLWIFRCSLRLATRWDSEEVLTVTATAQMPEAAMEPQAAGRIRDVLASRAGGVALARAMRGGGKRIWGDAGDRAGDGGNAAPELDSELVLGLSARAILILGESRGALLDISGEGSGKILRPGDHFSYLGKPGRVVSVTEKGLVVQWNGRRWQIPLGG